ncbi:MAG: phosphoribosylanthranilate isomerase [Bacteroidetes bacterium]|nr:phosphoribosylanthranilate isomerase [Bacteroidota bacterium]
MFLDEKKAKVKICGLTRLDHARYASGALADYLGFIFYPNSPRYISPEDAKEIINWVEGPECVGVFVNQPIEFVRDVATSTGVTVVQLHGDESPEYCEQLEHVKIIKAFRITPDMTSDHLCYLMEPYIRHVDHFLFDTYSKEHYGGTGETFNWDVIGDLVHDYEIFLSGGLNNNNVGKAIKSVQPYAVDVSSSLEESPGVKDFAKMEAFFDEIERINNAH